MKLPPLPHDNYKTNNEKSFRYDPNINMMCDASFLDNGQVNCVHEISTQN